MNFCFSLVFLFVSTGLFAHFTVSNDTVEVTELLDIYEENYKPYIDSFPSGMNILNRALELSKRNHYPLGQIKSNYYLGMNLFVRSSNNAKAVNYFYECIRICELEKNEEYYYKSYNYLGTIYYSNKKYEDALVHFKRTLNCNWKFDRNFENVPIYLMGLCYIELKMYDSAIYCLNKGLKIAIRNQQPYRINECRHGLVKVYINQGKLDLAKRMVNETIAFFARERTDAALAMSYQLLGTVYLLKSNYDSALFYALQAKRIGNTNKGATNLIEINQLLSEIYKNKGDYKNAYKYINEMQGCKDSIYQSDISTQIELSQQEHTFDKVKFEMEKDRKKAMQLAQGFGIMILVIGGALYFVRKERKKSEDLLLNILPLETAKELKKYGKAITKRHEEVTVMFFDVKEFSTLAEHIPPDSLILILDYYFSAFDDIISKYSDIEKIKTIGDCYMCVSGLHSNKTLHALNAVNAACDIMEFVAKTQEEVLRKFQYSFHFRGGLHSGAIVSGVVGSHKYAYDVWGDTVNIASRMESSGEIGKINISNATYELVKDHFNCSYRGKIEVKNQLSLEMYFVTRS